MTPDFWKGKKVFLTGHTGFKGAWLSIWLDQMGADVTGFSLPPPTDPSLFALSGIGKHVHSILGDIRDLKHLSTAITQAEPEIIIHLAAQSLVVYSHSNPVDTYSTNVMGTVNLLDSLRSNESVKAAIIVTSDKCYKNQEWPWGYRENDPLGGFDPYSNSKVCAELITDSYRRAFFSSGKTGKHQLSLASVRAGNVIAGGDWASNRLVPDVMNGLMERKTISIRNPESVRPWQHVLEPLDGYLTLAEKLYSEGTRYAEGWNFGPSEGDTKTVTELTSYLCSLWGNDATWEETPLMEPRETNFLRLDCSKSRLNLGWKPKLTLEETLNWIIEWYKCYHEKGDIFKITSKQIARYQSLE